MSAERDGQQLVAEASSAAITAGAALGAIAEAERTGELRARPALGSDVLKHVVLKHVARTAKRKREADSDTSRPSVARGRLGLSHREIAAAAQVSHGTVRAILARATPSANGDHPQTPVADEPAATGELAQ